MTINLLKYETIKAGVENRGPRVFISIFSAKREPLATHLAAVMNL